MTKLALRRPTPSFNDFFADLDLWPARMRRAMDRDPLLEPVGWMPPVEIEELEKELVLTMELPGLKKEQVDVSFEDGVLTIKGEKLEERTEEKKDRQLHVWERQYGAFHRAFTLPRTVDGGRISAQFKDGVLRVHLPRVTEAAPRGRKIEVADKM
ncbi:MAG: Hsp20/alpha crystallin family protein [Gemmatimonadetes bacterium]|nr:Hsp20/alpha crystallin family protein [Gemmatimonadota bacterium]